MLSYLRAGKYRHLVTAFLVLFFIISWMALTTHYTHAQAPKAPGFYDDVDATLAAIFGGPAKAIAGAVFTIPVLVWYVIMLLINLQLTTYLFITSYVLDNVFIYNVILNPMNMPSIIAGWTIIRNVFNGVFLILILFVAISTIFGLDKFGAKKVLSRIIVIAFLMNFSLAFTGALFGFGNALAKPFRDAIGKNVAGFIVGAARLQTISKPANPEQAQQQAILLKDNEDTCGLASLIPEEQAAALKLGCLQGAAAVFAAQKTTDWLGSVLDGWTWKFNETRVLMIINFFLLLTIISFWGAVILLITRIIAMSFLAILAPAAFFLYMIPGGEKHFSKWLQTTLCWAFVAPAFYFLFYIALLVLQAMAINPTMQKSELNFADNILGMLPYFIFLGFMWASITMGKKMGCTGATAAIDLGKKLGMTALAVGGAVATGGATMAAGAAASTAMGAKVVGGAAGGGMNATGIPYLGAAIKKIPGGKALSGAVQRYTAGGAQSWLASQGEEIDKKKKLYDGYSGPNAAEAFRKSSGIAGSTTTQVATAERLRDKKELHLLTPQEQERYASLATRFGRQEDTLKVNPGLATPQNVKGGADGIQTAIEKAIKSIKPQEVGKMSSESISQLPQDVRVKVMDAILQIFDPARFREMGIQNFDLFKQVVMDHFRQNQQALEPKMRQDTLQYLLSHMGLGIKPPKKTGTPASPGTPATPTVTPPATPKPPPQTFPSPAAVNPIPLAPPSPLPPPPAAPKPPPSTFPPTP